MSFSVDKCKIVHFGKANKTYDYSLDGQPSFYYEISGGHIGSCRCSEEGLCRPARIIPIPTPVSGFMRLRRVLDVT